MIELRWLLRGSSRVLQYRTMMLGMYWSDWQDVPEVDVNSDE